MDLSDDDYELLTGYTASVFDYNDHPSPEIVQNVVKRIDTDKNSNADLGDLRAWKSTNENGTIDSIFNNTQPKHPLDNVTQDANTLKTNLVQEALQLNQTHIFQIDQTFFSRLMDETMKPNSYYEKIVNNVHKTVTGELKFTDSYRDHVAPRAHLESMLVGYSEYANNDIDSPCVNLTVNQNHPNTTDFVTLKKSVKCVFSTTSIVEQHESNLSGKFCGIAYRSPDDVQAKRKVSGQCLMCILLHTYTRYLHSNSSTAAVGRAINLNRFRVITGVKGEFCEEDCVNTDNSRLVTITGAFPIWKQSMFVPATKSNGTPYFKLMYPVFHERSRETACRSVDPFVLKTETVDYNSINLYSLLRFPVPTELGLEGEFITPWKKCLAMVSERLRANQLFQDSNDKYNILFRNWFHMENTPISDSGFSLWVDACDFPQKSAEYSIFWTYSMRLRTVHYIYSHCKFFDLTIFNNQEHTLRIFALGHKPLFDLMKTFSTFPTDSQLRAHPDFLLVDPDYCVKKLWRCDPVLTKDAVSHVSIYKRYLPIDKVLKHAPVFFPDLSNTILFQIAMCKNFADSVDLLKYHKPSVTTIFEDFRDTVSPRLIFRDESSVNLDNHSIAMALYLRIAYAYRLMNILVQQKGKVICFCIDKTGIMTLHRPHECDEQLSQSRKGDYVSGRNTLIELERLISKTSDNVCVESFLAKDSSIHHYRRTVSRTSRELLYALKLFAYTHLDLLCSINDAFNDKICLDTEFASNETLLLENYPTPDRVLHAGALVDTRNELENILLFNKNQTSLEFKKNPYWMVLSATSLTNINKKQFTASNINNYIGQNLEFKKWITTLMRVSLLGCYPHSISVVPIEMAIHWHRRLGGFGKEISSESLCLAINRRKIFVRLCLQEYQIYMVNRSPPLVSEICRRFSNIRQLMSGIVYTASICNSIINSKLRLNETILPATQIKYTARHTFTSNLTNQNRFSDTLYSNGIQKEPATDFLFFDHQCVQSEQSMKSTDMYERRMRKQITIITTPDEDVGGVVESFIQNTDVLLSLPSVKVVHQNKIFDYIRANFVSTDFVKKNSAWIHECTPCNSSINWPQWVAKALQYLEEEDATSVLKEDLLIELENAVVKRTALTTPYPRPAYIPSDLTRSNKRPRFSDSDDEEDSSDEELTTNPIAEPLQITRAQCVQPLKRLQELQVNNCSPTPGNPCAMVSREIAPTTLYCLELIVSMMCPGDVFNFLWLKVFGFSSESISIIRAVEDMLIVSPHKQPFIRFDLMTPYERYLLFALSSYMIQHSSVVNVSIQCADLVENQIKVLERIHRVPRENLKPCNGNVVFSTRSGRCCNAIYLTSIGCKDVVNDYTKINNPVLIDGDRRTRAKYLTQTMPRKCISVPLVGQVICFPFQLYSQPTKMTTRMPKKPKTQFSKNGRIGRVGDGGFGSIHKQILTLPGSLPMFFFGRNLFYQDYAAVSPPLPLGYSGPLSAKGNGYIPKDYKYCGNNKIRNIVMADCCGCFIRLSLKNFGPWENSVIWCGMCPNSYNMRWLKPCCEECKQLFNIEDENIHLKRTYIVDKLTHQFRPKTVCHNC